MSDKKFHIDDHFIPDGLEFREEYMYAALDTYKRTKRFIALKRAAFVLSLVLFITGISIALLQRPATEMTALQDGSPVEKNADSTLMNSRNQQFESTQETSSSIDLDKGGEDGYKKGQSPAVESSETTQDQFLKAVDKGDSMSSGVGLPGQLSITKRKLQQKASTTLSKSESNNLNSSVAEHVEAKSENSSQSLDQPAFPIDLSATVSAEHVQSDLQPIEHRSSILLTPHTTLQYSKTLSPLPYSPWTLFAVVGMRAWSDYGFNRSPFKADGNFSLGMAYRRNHRWSGEFSGNFCTISGTAAPYTVVQRTYGEGFRETTYSYFTERLYQVGAGITAKYRLSSHHALGVGWKTDYLLTADNRIETGSATSFENMGATGVSAKGYVQGFRTIQHAIIFNYEYAPGKSKSVGVQYQHGLTDFTKNNYFGTSMDRNSMLSIYLRINLNK